jgi:hypothetical protein
MFKSASKSVRDFNDSLQGPFLESIVSTYDLAFKEHIPRPLDQLLADVLKKLTSFSERIVKRKELVTHRSTSIKLLAHQLKTHVDAVGSWRTPLLGVITMHQREATRVLRPFIKETLKDCYAECAAELGKSLRPGALLRY